MNPGQQDPRPNPRLSVNIPIRVHLLNTSLPERYGELLNISKSGAYFATSHRFHDGDILELSATIKTNDRTSGREWSYRGYVVRVERIDARGPSLGVAVAFDCRGMSPAEDATAALPNAAIGPRTQGRPRP